MLKKQSRIYTKYKNNGFREVDKVSLDIELNARNLLRNPNTITSPNLVPSCLIVAQVKQLIGK